MTALESLDALAARIAAGSGPDREIDTRFAWDVLCIGNTPMGLAEFTDALAGPGALFAEARRLWPDNHYSATYYPKLKKHRAATGDYTGHHPDLCRALMLAMVAARRAEIAGGGNV